MNGIFQNRRFFTHRIFLAVALIIAVSAVPAGPSKAANEANELVVQAQLTAESLLNNPDYQTLQTLLKDAKGVLIFPSMLKAAFFFGAEGGSGVLLARNADGSWGYPAFYTIGAGSFGLQWGGQDSQVIFAIMTDRGINSVINQQVKLGADVSVAVGPVGIGAEAATTAQLADMYSFSQARGAFAGVSFKGAVIYGRDGLNEDYYGTPSTATQIVIDHQFKNPAADGLRGALAGH